MDSNTSDIDDFDDGILNTYDKSPVTDSESSGNDSEAESVYSISAPPFSPVTPVQHFVDNNEDTTEVLKV